MKILIFSDCHWSSKTSIVRSLGKDFSIRLEYLINSMNWLNQLAIDKGCEEMICAGDFMDKSVLDDEELTALNEIKWNNLPCYFLCGNHESSVADLRYSSVKALENTSTRRIISNVEYQKISNTVLCFLPYVLETDKKNLSDYFKDKPIADKYIIISHNDIAGINYGGFESKLGFNINEIEDNCDLFLNGHLHNSEFISKKILNVGSFSGHNFTNDSFRYKYGVWVLDTDTLHLDFYENPYSLNFYKININIIDDLSILDTLKNNAVVSIKVIASLADNVNSKISTIKNILENRIVIDYESNLNQSNTDAVEQENIIKTLQGANPLQRLIQFCKSGNYIANSEILDQELAEICK